MSEFEKWWCAMREANNITGRDYACFTKEWIKLAFAAGQAASASRVAELEKRIAALWYDPRLDTANARITELEADCKVMAESQVKSHLCTYGDTPESCLLGIGESCNYNNRFIDGCPAYGNCACPACTIAAKYREVSK